MNCPRCNVSLFVSHRQGIEVDYCPKCQGVWLDRGELDKIIERSAAIEAKTTLNVPSASELQHSGESHFEYVDDHKDDDLAFETPAQLPAETTRTSFLNDIFEKLDQPIKDDQKPKP